MKSLLLLILTTTGILVLMRFSIASGLLTAGVLFLWGIAAFAICPLLQTLVVNHASARRIWLRVSIRAPSISGMRSAHGRGGCCCRQEWP